MWLQQHAFGELIEFVERSMRRESASADTRPF